MSRRVLRGHRRRSGDVQGEHSAAALAAVAVGLKPNIIMPEERKTFRTQHSTYLATRNTLLERWWNNVTTFITREDAIAMAGDDPQAVKWYARVYDFLLEHGHINFGLCAPSAPDNGTKDTAAGITDHAVVQATWDIMQQVDAATTTGRQIKAAVMERLGVTEWTDPRYKDIVKQQMDDFANGKKRPLAKKSQPTGPKVPPPPTRQRDARVIVVGAGPAGLTAALHLQRNGIAATVLEARDRIGGRVYSFQGNGFSVPVDLGASLITGCEVVMGGDRAMYPDRSALLCQQLGVKLHTLDPDNLPLLDVCSGQRVATEVDLDVAKLADRLLDDSAELAGTLPTAEAERLSLEGGLRLALDAHLAGETAAQRAAAQYDSEQEDAPAPKAPRRLVVGADDSDDEPPMRRPSSNGAVEVDLPPAEGSAPQGPPGQEAPAEGGGGQPTLRVLGELESRLLQWQWANAEYGNSACLDKVSLLHWNQDEECGGGFGGSHAMVVGGYVQPLEAVAAQLTDLRLTTPVQAVEYTEEGVKVATEAGEVVEGDAVIVTVPLGCLKAGAIRFSPPLPGWKLQAIRNVGFGNLNKVVMEFDRVFWDDSADFFGAVLDLKGADPLDTRGRCFQFWNVHRFSGAPVLTALLAGRAADEAESLGPDAMLDAALRVLRSIFGEEAVPQPKAWVVSQWAAEPFTRGSYSYVAVGASGEDYDLLSRPWAKGRLGFAGEHTSKAHLDTVGGAMLTGLREAVRVLGMLTTARPPPIEEDDEEEESSSEEERPVKSKKRARGEVARGAIRKASDEWGPKKIQHAQKAGGGGGGSIWDAIAKSGIEVDSEGQEEEAEEEGDPEGDLLPHQRGGRRRVTAAELYMPRSEEEQRASRDLWKALIMAESGEVELLVGELALQSSIEARVAACKALVNAATRAHACAAGSLEVMQAMQRWMLSVMGDARAFALLESVLKVLLALPFVMDTLKDSGVARTVRELVTGHPQRDMRRLAEAVVVHWLREADGEDVPLESPAPKQPRPAAAPAPVQLREEDQQLLREKEAAIAQAEEEARRLAQEVALLEAQSAKASVTPLPIVDFESFRGGGEQERKKQHSRGETKGERSKVPSHPSAAASRSVVPSKDPFSRGSSATPHHTAAKAPSASEHTPALKEAVVKCIEQVLHPLYKQGEFSKETYKLVWNKAKAKVLGTAKPGATAESFLTTSRREKTKALVLEYVQKYSKR